MCRVIAVSNQKGGVGKTVSCVNLGIGLAQEGKKVLLIDADPQGSLTISMGYEEPDEMEYSLATLMMNIVNDEKLNIEKTILHHKEGVDLIPANIELSAIEVSLVNAMSRELILRSMVDKLREFYDFIIIDCIHDCDLYDIWKNEKLEYITVDFVRRIPIDIFEKWYANQDIYRKVTHIPTAEELEKDYICLQDAADLLGISREKLAKIARSEEIGRLLDSTICNNKRWITRKSFQLFLNAQNVYHITDDEDKKKESRGLQEKETLSLMVKEYISRQDAAELAGVNVSTVTKWMQSGEFQCIGAGKVLRVHRQQFLKWLEKNREGVM